MDNPELSEIRNLPVPELAEKVAALSADDLQALRAAEAADANPRKGALAAIDDALAKLPPPAARAKAEAKPDAPPAWQARDYSGPLTCDQMQWRQRHIKPVGKVQTK